LDTGCSRAQPGSIIATPNPPPAENEQWRERRRAERAAKQAQRADEEAAVRNDREAPAEPPGAIGSDEPTATGDDIASEQAQSPDVEHVLDALDSAATAMRA